VDRRSVDESRHDCVDPDPVRLLVDCDCSREVVARRRDLALREGTRCEPRCPQLTPTRGGRRVRTTYLSVGKTPARVLAILRSHTSAASVAGHRGDAYVAAESRYCRVARPCARATAFATESVDVTVGCHADGLGSAAVCLDLPRGPPCRIAVDVGAHHVRLARVQARAMAMPAVVPAIDDAVRTDCNSAASAERRGCPALAAV
jgi:hypothetical protein